MIEKGLTNLQTTALEVEDGRVTAIYIVRNPDKLADARRVMDVDPAGAIAPP